MRRMCCRRLDKLLYMRLHTGQGRGSSECSLRRSAATHTQLALTGSSPQHCTLPQHSTTPFHTTYNIRMIPPTTGQQQPANNPIFFSATQFFCCLHSTVQKEYPPQEYHLQGCNESNMFGRQNNGNAVRKNIQFENNGKHESVNNEY